MPYVKRSKRVSYSSEKRTPLIHYSASPKVCCPISRPPLFFLRRSPVFVAPRAIIIPEPPAINNQHQDAVSVTQESSTAEYDGGWLENYSETDEFGYVSDDNCSATDYDGGRIE